MSDAPAGETGGERNAGRLARPAVFPVVRVPAPVADGVGLALLAAGGFQVLSGAIQATSAHYPGAGPMAGFPGAALPELHLTAADRLLLFSRGAALFTAVLLLIGAVSLISGSRGDRQAGRRRLAIAVTGALAAIVVLANLALCWEVLATARGTLIGAQLIDRFSSLAGLLAPVVLAVGVVFYIGIYLTANPPISNAAT